MQGIEMNELKELISHCHDAEFEYNGCCYQIRSMGNSDESVFWDNLNALLGAQ